MPLTLPLLPPPLLLAAAAADATASPAFGRWGEEGRGEFASPRNLKDVVKANPGSPRRKPTVMAVKFWGAGGCPGEMPAPRYKASKGFRDSRLRNRKAGLMPAETRQGSAGV